VLAYRAEQGSDSRHRTPDIPLDMARTTARPDRTQTRARGPLRPCFCSLRSRRRFVLLPHGLFSRAIRPPAHSGSPRLAVTPCSRALTFGRPPEVTPLSPAICDPGSPLQDAFAATRVATCVAEVRHSELRSTSRRCDRSQRLAREPSERSISAMVLQQVRPRCGRSTKAQQRIRECASILQAGANAPG
jgi:hypothetical protein